MKRHFKDNISRSLCPMLSSEKWKKNYIIPIEANKKLVFNDTFVSGVYLVKCIENPNF